MTRWAPCWRSWHRRHAEDGVKQAEQLIKKATATVKSIDAS